MKSAEDESIDRYSFGSWDGSVKRASVSARSRRFAKDLQDLLPEGQRRASQYSNRSRGRRVKDNTKAGGAVKTTFVDAAAMKEKVRQNLSKPKYAVADYYYEKGVFQAIARSQLFDKITLGVIAFNALWIAIDTDMNDSAILLEAKPVFIVAENFFCTFFTFEWFVRFMSFRRKRDGLRDTWFVFDSLMVLMMVLETWVFTAVLLVAYSENDLSGGGSAGVIRLARLLRLSRMARMAKLLRVMPELMIMIKGMKAATRSVFFTLLLLVVIMYVFAIAFVQLAEGTEASEEYFDAVPSSMYSLLIYGIFLDNIGDLTEMIKSEPVLLPTFFAFVLLGALTVMNMLVGVLCEVVSAVAATEQEEMLVTYVNDKLSRVMAILDSDGGGTITKLEFVQILDNAEAVKCLSDAGIDVSALIDLADYIFEDDSDESAKNDEETHLDFATFMEVVLQMRGTNQATVKDIVDLRKFMRMSMLENHKLTTMILERLREGARVSQELLRRIEDVREKNNHHPHERKACMSPNSKVHFQEEEKRVENPKDENSPFSLRTVDDKDEERGCPTKVVDYKVDDGSLPMLPKQTPSGQLLSCMPIIPGDSSAPVPPTAEDLALKGKWWPIGKDFGAGVGDGASAKQRVASPQRWASSGPPPIHTAPLDFDLGESKQDLENQKQQDAAWSRVKSGVGIDPNTLFINTLPRPRVDNSASSLPDDDMEALQRHVDAMFRQLAIGLNDAFVLAGRRQGVPI